MPRKIHCFKCRDKGVLGGCPECGLALKEVRIGADSRQSIDGSKVLELDWISRVADQKEKGVWLRLENMAKKGITSDKSLILCSPATIWKETLIKKIRYISSQHGLSVMKVVNGYQIYKYMTGTKEERKLSTFTYKDLMECDVVFVTVSENDKGFSFGYGLYQTIVERAERGKSTYVISDISWTILKERTRNTSLPSLELDKEAYRLDKELNEEWLDRRKYPVIVDIR